MTDPARAAPVVTEVPVARRGPRRRPCDDRGSSIVETALITPIVLLLVFAVLEYGLVFRDYLSIGDAASDATRMATVQGNKPRFIETDDGHVGVSADYSTVSKVREGLAGLDPGSIDRIVVFRALGPGAGSPVDQVPAACKAGPSSQAASCNVYDPIPAFQAIQAGDAAHFACGDGSGPACGWPPHQRQDGPEIHEIDYVGVYIRVDRPYLTGMFGDHFTIEHAHIGRIEPGEVE